MGGHDVVVVIETDHQRLSLFSSGVEVTLHAAHPLVFQPLEAGFLLTREAFVDPKHAAQFPRLEVLLELVDQPSVVVVVVTRWTRLLFHVVWVRPFVAALDASEVSRHRRRLRVSTAAWAIALFVNGEIVCCFATTAAGIESSHAP